MKQGRFKNIAYRLLLILTILLICFISADAATWYVNSAVNKKDVVWEVSGIGLADSADVVFWFADSAGTDYDTLSTGVYRNHGKAALATGLTDGNRPELVEGILQPHQSGNGYNGGSNYQIINSTMELSPGAADFWAGVFMRTTTSAIASIFGKYSPTNPANQREWIIIMNTDIAPGRFSINLSDDGTLAAGHGKVRISSISVNDGKWHFLSFTWISDVIVMYIDGVPVIQEGTINDPITSIFSGTSKPLVGANNSGARQEYFPGHISWAVYDTGVSCPNDAQMLAIYNAMISTGSSADPFPSIQSAYYMGTAGDTILVNAGRYQETLTISTAFDYIGSNTTTFGNWAELYGAALPAPAGTVGATVSQKIELGFLTFRGWTAAKGLLGTSTSDGSLFHHLEFDSCLNAVDFDGAASGDSLINCTIDGASLANATGFRATTSSAVTVVVKNCIFVNTTTALTKAAAQTLTETNNDFFGNTTNYAAALNATDLTVNAFFKGGNDYRPQKFSRVLNAGAVIHSGVSPFNYLQAAPAMGAWEMIYAPSNGTPGAWARTNRAWGRQ